MNYQFFAQNTQGRDFICADVHGYFDILEQCLAKHVFDPAVDRLFSLGDLIDQGEGSIHVLEWLAKPWFHAIQGNHERMLINVVESQSEEVCQQWYNWGGHWAKDLDASSLQKHYEALTKLPAGIEIELLKGCHVGLVHAELPDKCDWLAVKQALLNAPKNIEDNHDISNMFWNRAQPFYDSIAQEKIEAVQNIEHVFHGHTPMQAYKTITNRSFLDLGSYGTGKIGFIDARQYLKNES